MRKLGTWIIILFSHLGGGALIGCGPALPVKPPAQSDPVVFEGCKKGSAFQLGVRIVPAQNRSRRSGISVPLSGIDLNRPSHYEKGAKICEDQLFFPKVLSLSEDLFFVWKADLSSQKILSAWATHQIYAANNQWVNETTPIQAVRDLKESRFYISIASVLSQSQYYKKLKVNRSDTQILRVDLQLKNGSREALEIRFYAKQE
jgi:hypothetical protein